MAVIETWLEQDIKEPVQVKHLCGSFFSHNGNANRIGVKVFDNGSPVTLSGTVSGYAVLPDGTTVPCTGSLSGNQASVLLPAAAYVPGNICVTIMLTSGTTITTLGALTGTVVMARTDTQVDPGSVVTDWTNTINAAMQSVETSAANLTSSFNTAVTNLESNFATATANLGAIVATPYASLTFPVALGKYTYYNNNLYRCTTPITTSEDFNPAHWTAVKLGDDVSDLKSALSDIETLDNEINPAWVIGGLNNLGGENSNTNRIRTGYIETKNDTFLHIAIGTGYYANVFRFDDSQSLLGYSDWFSSESDITLTNLGYIRIAVKRSDDADMSATEGSNIALTYSNELLDTLNDIEEKNEKASYNIGQIMSDHYIPNYDIGTQIAITLQNRKYWDISGTTAELKSNNSFDASTAIQVIPEEDYQLTATSGGSLKLASWAIVDASYNVLANGEKKSSFYTKTESFHIPQNGKYLLITVARGDTPVLIKAGYSPINNLLYGKKIAIIGDSISTNGNTGTDSNVPEIKIESADVGVELSAYLTYYDVQAGLSLGGHTFTSAEIGTEVTFTPVEGDIGKVIGLPNNYNENTVTTWWEVMQQQLHCSFIPNTWSGASITSHEGNSSQYKTSYGWHEATIRKCGIRTPGTMTRTEPDLIIIYRGTNDFSHSPYTLLTDNYFDNYNWEYPANDSVTGGYGYKEGLCLTIKKLRDAYPNAKIFICTLNVFKRVNYSHFPTNNGINSLPQYNDAIREVADFMGCGVIDFDKDGITFENCYSQGYITDSSTTPTHPSDKGHKAMGLKAIADLKAQYSNMT